jgi:hypothetical protein
LNVLTAVAAIILLYWIVAIGWVLSKKDWE